MVCMHYFYLCTYLACYDSNFRQLSSAIHQEPGHRGHRSSWKIYNVACRYHAPKTFLSLEDPPQPWPHARWNVNHNCGVWVTYAVWSMWRSVTFNFLGRDFFNAISDKDAERFTQMLIKWLCALCAGIPVFVFRDYFQVRLLSASACQAIVVCKISLACASPQLHVSALGGRNTCCVVSVSCSQHVRHGATLLTAPHKPCRLASPTTTRSPSQTSHVFTASRVKHAPGAAC